MNIEQKTQALEYLDVMDKRMETMTDRKNQIIILLSVFLILSIF